MADNPFTDSNAHSIAGVSFISLTEYYLQYYASGPSHTARAKRLDLKHFIEFLRVHHSYSKPEKICIRDWDSSSVQSFVEARLSQGEAPATVARRLATIKHMGRTLSERIAGFVNPAREVKAPKWNATKPKALSAAEINAAREKGSVRSLQRQTFSRLRNQVLFELLLDTGIRADEIRLLRLGQIEEDCTWIKNVRTKGRRYRNVYITSDMQPRLKEYLELRKAKLNSMYTKLSKSEDKNLPVFISVYKAVPGDVDSFLMGAKSIWRAINELSNEVKLHPHLLRHSYAHDLLSSSNDIRLVAQALGHSDVRITMRYTERQAEQIAEALEKSRKG